MDLADQKCVPCRGGVPAMDRARANELLRELGAGWRLNYMSSLISDACVERHHTPVRPTQHVRCTSTKPSP